MRTGAMGVGVGALRTVGLADVGRPAARALRASTAAANCGQAGVAGVAAAFSGGLRRRAGGSCLVSRFSGIAGALGASWGGLRGRDGD